MISYRLSKSNNTKTCSMLNLYSEPYCLLQLCVIMIVVRNKTLLTNFVKDGFEKSFLPARKSSAGMSECKVNASHNTTSTNVSDFLMTKKQMKGERARDFGTLRRLCVKTRMIVTRFYPQRISRSGLFLRRYNVANTRAALPTRRYLLVKAGGDANFRDTRGKHRLLAVSATNRLRILLSLPLLNYPIEIVNAQVVQYCNDKSSINFLIRQIKEISFSDNLSSTHNFIYLSDISRKNLFGKS